MQIFQGVFNYSFLECLAEKSKAFDKQPLEIHQFSSHPNENYKPRILKERGWTATMIAQLLPHHDASRMAYVRLPSSAHVKLYLRVRVEEVELSDDFLIVQEKANQAKIRRGSAARTAQHQVLLKRCVQGFRPTYTWPERWCQRSDWQLSLGV